MMTESEPTMSFEYRNIQCRVYDLGAIGEIAYIQIGDRWKEVIGVDDSYDNIQSEIEDSVDDAIESAFDDNDGLLDRGDYDPFTDPFDTDDPLDIDPIPDSDDDPIPPYGRHYWMSI